ncbi:MAG: LPS assembly protein LptD, partial [Bdellovibrionales bacterium]|nr:LPS assembly protein LptD [Bdellovibrionales bacterium]
MSSSFRVLAFLLCFLALSHTAWGFQSRSGDIMFSADEGRLQTLAGATPADKEQWIYLKGNVQIIVRGQHVTCDEAQVNTTRKEIKATGHVVVVSAESLIQGDRIDLSSADNTGTIYQGYVRSGQVQFQGEVIRKLGPTKFEADKASYTACLMCPPDWSFSGSKMEAELGGYTFIKNPILKMGGVPVFWLPFITVPMKSERQSGFLFPFFEPGSANGFTFGQSFFWAVNRSQDLTATVRHYDLRGTKGIAEYRYVLDSESRGKLTAAYLPNDKSLTLPDRSRWDVQYNHIQQLPEGFTHRVDIHTPGDVRYPRDFQLEVPGNGLPALENRMSLSKAGTNYYSSLEANYNFNILQPGYTRTNTDAVHRFPEIKYSLINQKGSDHGAIFRFDASYVNFSRGQLAFDDRYRNKHVEISDPLDIPKDPTTNPTNPDPRYDGADPDRTKSRGIYNAEYDQIRTGQRLDFNPRVSYPINIGKWLDLMPSLSFQQFIYAFDLPRPDLNYASRGMLRADLSARTRYSGIFGDMDDPAATRYKHEVVPEIHYTNLPWLYTTPGHPFFGPREVEPFYRSTIPMTDLDNLQFDYRDRILDRDVVTLSVTNRLIRRKWKDGRPEYKQIGTLRLSQSYDFYETYRKLQTGEANENRLPLTDFQAHLDIRSEQFETNTVLQYFPPQGPRVG